VLPRVKPVLGPASYGPALARLDRALGARGRRRTGAPEIVRRWSVSTVLRAPTDTGPVWYKAVPAVFAHEGRVTAWLATIAPDAVPEVLGHGDGWLITADLGGDAGVPVGHPLDTVLRLQHATIGRTAEVLAAGCPDRRPARLLADTQSLVERADVLTPARRRALQGRLPALSRLVARIDRLSIPATLVHGDVNGDNSRWDGEHWRHIDWTDACLAHPFVELAQPLIDATPAERARIEARFTRAWSRHAPAADVQVALGAAPALGAAHQAGTYRAIIDGVGPVDDHPQMLEHWIDRLVTALGDEA
jgi:hypothetical protein